MYMCSWHGRPERKTTSRLLSQPTAVVDQAIGGCDVAKRLCILAR